MDGVGQSCRSLKAKAAQRRWYHDRTSGDFRSCLLCDPSVNGLGARNDNRSLGFLIGTSFLVFRRQVNTFESRRDSSVFTLLKSVKKLLLTRVVHHYVVSWNEYDQFG